MKPCLQTVHYSILVNRDSIGNISPGKGLRQGDPLSPYLFILCNEGLSIILKYYERRGVIHGVKVCKGTPILSLVICYQLFLFCKAGKSEATTLKNILDIYGKTSNQLINYQKSEILLT